MALKRTPFYEFHKAGGGRLIDFGGWEMPVQFAGIKKEHLLVRESVGLFDVSHMGELRVRGPGALDAVQGLVTNDVAAIGDDQALYTVMCNDRGGIVDDLLIYRISAEDMVLVVNASNIEKDLAWVVQRNPCPDRAHFANQSDYWAQVAVQGRKAQACLQPLTSVDLAAMDSFHFQVSELAGVPGCVIARTGYTGEDGFEVYLPATGAADIWPAILQAGQSHGIAPIGLGARDTLRLEAKLCLYGNDIDDNTTPLEAALAWTVKLDKGVPFIGIEALRAQRQSRPRRRLVCLVVEGRIARPHCPILHDGEQVGEVTSGTRSPSLQQNIALGYVPTRIARPGNQVQVDVRGKLADAQVVKPPFYRRPY